MEGEDDSKKKIQPAEIKEVMMDDDQIYMAVDVNDNMIASHAILRAGIIVNLTRERVVEFRKTLSPGERATIKKLIFTSMITAHRAKLGDDCIFFTGRYIDMVKQGAIARAGKPGKGPMGTTSCKIDGQDMITLEKFAAVVADDADFDLHLFLVEPGETGK